MIATLLNRVCSDSSPVANIDIPLPADDVLEALDNRRRRELIRRLAAASESDGEAAVELGEVSEYIAAVENGVPVKAVTPKQRKAVYIALYQSHLPTMERLDIVSVDDRNVIRAATDIGALADLLTVVDDA